MATQPLKVFYLELLYILLFMLAYFALKMI